MDFVLLILGLVVLVGGGEFLVRGAVAFSAAMRISPMIIGLTIVAFGTSAPELLVSVTSAMNGNPGIAIGNVMGSNIANIALVLGATVLIMPIVVDSQTKKVDFPVMLLATLLFYMFAMDGIITQLEGLILFLILIVYLGFLIYTSNKRRQKRLASMQSGKNEFGVEGSQSSKINENDHWEESIEEAEEEIDEYKKEPFWKSTTFLLLGFLGLYFGAEWFIKGAVGIAEYLLAGNPDKDVIIGVTVVALGTSAPELVASTIAALRKQTDLSLGNLIGSNIFNIFAVIGITSMVHPIEVTKSAMHFDMYWVIGIALLMLLFLLTTSKIKRWEGVVLLGSYVTYVVLILLKVKGIL